MLAVALWLSTLTALVGARIYDRCELARDLQLLGVDRDHIATWVCIAYHESRYDTAAQNYGSGDHGLLQISELYWCGPGKACGAPCSAFRDEDISDDVKCALQIYKEHTRLQGDGFLAWVVYPHHCKQNAKKYVVDCDIKNLPVKFDHRARYFKNSDVKYEPKSHTVNNLGTPRFLAINSIFQGSYVNELERNYYDNNKQSNWLNFKVDNIDDLKLPGAASDSQRLKLLELTTRPTTTTTLDPDLIGIKPPSPRKIESNQFRRRKTFAEPRFLKNRFNGDQKTSTTTSVPLLEISESSLSFQEDLSRNIFLNLSPSVRSKSLSEFPSKEIKPNDFSQYHIKTTPVEESSSSAILTYDDLAQNPFLNSLPGFNFKSSTNSPSKVTNINQNNIGDYTLATSRPMTSLRSFKQIEWQLNPEIDTSIFVSESKKTNAQINENAENKVSLEDLYQNPFLSHLLRGNNTKPVTESVFQRTKLRDKSDDFRITTAKPTKELVFSSSQLLETSSKIPRILHERGRARYLSDFDKNTTEKPTTESSTVAYSTRRYKTISRQRANTNQNELKMTTAIQPNSEKPVHSSTVKPNNSNMRNFRIESTTSKATTTISEKLYTVTDYNRREHDGQKTVHTPFYTTNRTALSREPDVEIFSTTVRNLQTIDKQQSTSTTEAAITSRRTSRPHITSRQQAKSLETTRSPQITRTLETISNPTTILDPSSKSFWKEPRDFPITTSRPNLTWVTPTNISLNSTTTYSTTTQTPAITSTIDATTAKTTISIFDLYLRPSTKPSYKPFEFTRSKNKSYQLSIFSDGTTKPPPSYFASINRTK